MLSCLSLKIDRLTHGVLNIVALCNNNTKLPSNETCAGIRVWSDKNMYSVVTLEFVLYRS